MNQETLPCANSQNQPIILTRCEGLGGMIFQCDVFFVKLSSSHNSINSPTSFTFTYTVDSYRSIHHFHNILASHPCRQLLSSSFCIAPHTKITMDYGDERPHCSPCFARHCGKTQFFVCSVSPPPPPPLCEPKPIPASRHSTLIMILKHAHI